jgi:L-alanine-DL-glutamate epimerase-like enolase superfamily enzyme
MLRKVFALAAAHNTTVMVHSFYDSPGLLAALHATTALGGNDSLIEWRHLELEAQLHGPVIPPRNGCIAVPTGPGLGLESDIDVIRDFRVSPSV